MPGFYKFTCIVLIWVLFAAAVAPPSEAAISCGTVINYLQPCIPYVVNNAPLGNCCSGIKGLYGAAKTTGDRKSVCNCLKSAAASYSGPIVAKAAALPAKCGINLPYKISPSTDCSKVT